MNHQAFPSTSQGNNPGSESSAYSFSLGLFHEVRRSRIQYLNTKLFCLDLPLSGRISKHSVLGKLKWTLKRNAFVLPCTKRTKSVPFEIKRI